MEVLIVDDDPLIHEIMSAVVRKALDQPKVQTVSDLESAFQRLAHHDLPDIAFLDLGLPGQSGLDSLRRFRWKFPDIPVVVVSAVDDPRAVRVALDAGASGYIPKASSPDVMVAAVRLVAAGGTYVPPLLTKREL
jgi:DNA-binding NarL/FixJ family response regulator